MNETVLFVSPHADDETLGCGGAMRHHKCRGDKIHWMIVTKIEEGINNITTSAKARESEINQIVELTQFDGVHQLNYPTTKLDNVPLTDLVSDIGDIVNTINPTLLYLPFSGDVHSDHVIVFKAASACGKWFRYPSIRSVFVYETLSETNFSIDPGMNVFKPNYYLDISQYLEDKIKMMNIYENEIDQHPFPRSSDAIRSLALLRGSEAGVEAAEAFMLLKHIEK